MAASSMKDIKLRIKSVESTMQITKAMELVASSKLRRAKERAEETRPYFTTLHECLTDIAYGNTDFSSPFVQQREVKKTCYIMIAGDRGLAGGYNTNLFKTVAEHMDGKVVCVLPIGKKAVEYCAHRGLETVTDAYATAEDVSLGDCFSIARMLCGQFRKGAFDALYVGYTNFVSMLSQQPQGPPGSNAPRSRSPSRRRTAPSPAALIIGPQIKPPCYLLCLYHIDKRLRINLPYFRDNSPLFLPGNHAVQQLPLLALIAAHPLKQRGIVMSDLFDLFVNPLRRLRYNQQGQLLITAVQPVENLGRRELKNDGIQRLLPAEQKAGRRQHQHIARQNVVPGFFSLALGKENRDKIRTAAGSAGKQAQTDGKPVDQSAEHTDQKDVRGNRVSWKNVCQNTGKNDSHTGIQGEFLPDKPKADHNRRQVQQQINGGIRHRKVKKFIRRLLDQQSQARKSAGEQSPRPDKAFDIHGHHAGGGRHQHQPFHVPFPTVLLHNASCSSYHASKSFRRAETEATIRSAPASSNSPSSA